jgi:hypothetical protein
MKIVRLAKESNTQADGENFPTRWAHWLVVDSEQRVVGEFRVHTYEDPEVVEEPTTAQNGESTP